MKKYELRKVIERVMESESTRFENMKVLPEGQRSIVKRKLVELMVEKLAKDFFVVPDVYARLQIMKFFADYSGQKPADVKVLEINPYDGMSEEELEAEERRLLSYDEE